MQFLASVNRRGGGSWLAALVLGIAAALPARAALLFSEDFESYAPGSNLVGQGGWAEGNVGGSVLTVNPGTFLPTRVLDGRATTGVGQANVATHSLPLASDPNVITTLRFDAYATTATPITHNMAVGIIDAPVPALTQLAIWYPEPFQRPQGWTFTFGGDLFHVIGGFDQPVTMAIVIDGIANEIYGLYDFGSGMTQTPHFGITDAQITAFRDLWLFVDHRDLGFYTGMEVDNIQVFDNTGLPTPIPEPASLLLLGAGLVGLLGSRKICRPNGQTV